MTPVETFPAYCVDCASAFRAQDECWDCHGYVCPAGEPEHGSHCVPECSECGDVLEGELCPYCRGAHREHTGHVRECLADARVDAELQRWKDERDEKWWRDQLMHEDRPWTEKD